MAELTLARLKALLHYDPETGAFTWVKARPRCRIGGRAGTVYSCGYEYLWIDKARYLSHRVAWLYMTGRWPEHEIDHKDRIRSNNKFANLRELSASHNHFRIISKRTRGVSAVRGRYRAKIGVNGKEFHLGYFSDEASASDAYMRAAEKFYGSLSSEIRG